MKTVQQTTKDALRGNTTLYTSTRAIVEWNYNRIYNGQVLNGTYSGTEWYPEYYPIASIIGVNRPSRSGIVTVDFGQNGLYPVQNTMTGWGRRSRASYGPSQAVYNAANVDAKYKYWVSPTASAASGSTKYTITDVTPTVNYTASFAVNKLRVIFEDSQVKPVDFTIEVQFGSGNPWTVVSTSPAVTNGVVEIYLQANGTWSATPAFVNTTMVSAVRVNVTSVSQPASRVGVIEIAPIRASDITSYVEGYDFQTATSEQSFVSPLGSPSANTGKLTINNFDQTFSNSNPGSPYQNMLTKYHLVYVDEGVTVGGSTEWIRSGTMLTDTWPGQDVEQTSINLIDKAVLLQNTKPLPMLIKNRTAGECIWRILESVGFTDYNYTPVASGTVIPYFWVNGEDTVWDTISKLSEQMQMAVYFDDYGILQIDSRDTIFNTSAAKAWTFYGQNGAGSVPDIISIDKTYQYAANVVNVNWTPTSISDVVFGTPSMETSWAADGDVVLRSSPMASTLSNITTDSIYINPTDAATWPYKGIYAVEDEYVSYNGKGYTYYDNNNNFVNTVLYTQDDYDKIQRDYQNYSWRNFFTGLLATDKRGYYGSPVSSHNPGKSTVWETWYSQNAGTGSRTRWETGVWVNYSAGMLHMENTPQLASCTTVTSRVTTSGVPVMYGTSVRFPSNGKGTARHGGLAFCLGTDTGQSGYYMQVIQSDKITPDQRKSYQELTFYSRQGGTNKVLWTGARQINPDTDYSIMVQFNPFTFNYVIWFEDQPIVSAQIPSGSRPPTTNRFGVFNKFYGTVEYDHVWSSTLNSTVIGADMPDYASILDRINGGYLPNAAQTADRIRTWYAGDRYYMLSAPFTNRVGITFDDFSPLVHEVREFNVKYTKFPAIYSRLYSSNEIHSWNPSFTFSPFGAKFIIAHYGRDKFAVLNGSDSYSFGADNPVDQKLLVYGRTVNTEDALTYTVRNDNSVALIGETAVDFDASWIQSEDVAKALGDWIIKHWGSGQDEIQIVSFYNPLLEIGDIVGIEYTALSLTAADKYVISGAQHGFDGGPTTTFTLRKLPSGV